MVDVCKNTKELRSLTADAAVLFPVEFLNANPNEIRASFLRMKADALGTPQSASSLNKSTNATQKATTKKA